MAREGSQRSIEDATQASFSSENSAQVVDAVLDATAPAQIDLFGLRTDTVPVDFSKIIQHAAESPSPNPANLGVALHTTIPTHIDLSGSRADTVPADFSKINQQAVGIGKDNEKRDELGKKASVIESIPVVGSLASTLPVSKPRKKVFVIVGTLLVLLLLIFPLLLHYNLLLPTPQSIGPNQEQSAQRAQTNPHTVSCASLSSETNCTSQDPIDQGCSVDAYTIAGGISYINDNNGMAIGEVDLRSSRICQSNWARITVYQSCSYVNIYVNAKRTQQTYQGREYGAVEEPYVVSNPGCMSMYSMTTSMVYAPGGVKTQACGGIDGYGGSCTKLI